MRSEEGTKNFMSQGPYHTPPMGPSNQDFPVEDLPIAMRIDEGEEVVIDGIIVEPEHRQKKLHNFFHILFLVMSMVSFVVAIITRTLLLHRSRLDISSSYHCPNTTMTSIYHDRIKNMMLQVSGEEVINDKNSMQHYILKGLACEMPRLLNESIMQQNETDKIIQRYAIRVVLVSLASASIIRPTEIIELISNTEILHECKLQGVICDDNNRVVGIVIKNERFTARGGGFLPREISALKSLTHLVLSRSAILGTIPSEIGKLEHLQVLDLNSNSLTGHVPSELGQLGKLDIMLLNSNSFEKSIPSEMGDLTSLIYMDISHNQFTGTIPREFERLNNLIGFKIQGNHISGSLEFLCDSNLTNLNQTEKNTMYSETLSYSMGTGLLTDCETNKVVQGSCSCCKCVS